MKQKVKREKKNKCEVNRTGSHVLIACALGFVYEVDYSDVEKNDDEGIGDPRPPPLKLTVRQQFLVCIGWNGPKQLSNLS
uniref:Uncharacterized protein n=1 Tax=Heterorhabditis bacteriophora TaxID=37862 RepID=A0A1I7WXI1_HETBA